MFCGSCFRDNALAAALKSLGHEIVLQPIYTPTRTDEENVSSEDVLFGGISIYLQQNFSLFRKSPRFLDRNGSGVTLQKRLQTFCGRDAC